MTYFGIRLQSLRKQDNLTQLQLATALGVKKSTIGMWENGNREPNFEMLESIADYFNVPIATFFPTMNPTSTDVNTKFNIVKIAGRDGSYTEKLLTDEDLAALSVLLDRLPDASDDL